MHLAIIGSRSFSDYNRLSGIVKSWFYNGGASGDQCEISSIISGGATGVDSLAARFAKEENIHLVEHLPDWERFGKRAGFIRNEDIIKNCSCVLAIWDGISKGTGNSLSIAKRLKKPTLIIYF